VGEALQPAQALLELLGDGGLQAQLPDRRVAPAEDDHGPTARFDLQRRDGGAVTSGCRSPG
jgi:hypothetical protein